jgi:hypothetical protein
MSYLFSYDQQFCRLLRVHPASVPSNNVHFVKLNPDAGSDDRREYAYIIISDKKEDWSTSPNAIEKYLR